jgi:RNA polymerase sigma-70 factor (ECF subfamily)
LAAETHDRQVASPEDVVVNGTSLLETIRLLERLTPEQREVLVLRFVADLTLEDVARITGRRVGAVKQLQRRGVDNLRRHLNGPTFGTPITKVPVRSIAEAR